MFDTVSEKAFLLRQLVKRDLTSKYKQIGNAVPVKLAETIATHLYAILSNIVKRDAKERKTD